VEGILFDCDGVLVDSLESAALAWDAWSATYAPGFDFRTQIEHGVRAADTVAGLVAAELLEEAIAALEDEEVRGAGGTVPIDGAVHLTSSLPRSGWGVVTSGARRLAIARLVAAGHALPDALVTADDVTRGKPHPEPYVRGAVALGLAPARCAVVEDASAGVRAARAAGIGFIVGVGDHLEGSIVDALVPDLTWVRYEAGILVIGSPNPD
jgi:sugar-phosphatase